MRLGGNELILLSIMLASKEHATYMEGTAEEGINQAEFCVQSLRKATLANRMQM